MKLKGPRTAYTTKQSQPNTHRQEKPELKPPKTGKNKLPKASPQQQKQLFNSPARAIKVSLGQLQYLQELLARATLFYLLEPSTLAY